MSYCEHYACRCARAAELVAMADAKRNPSLQVSLLRQAIAVHSQRVECRQPEGKDGHEERSGRV